MLPTKIWFIWPSGSRGEYCLINRPSSNKNCLWRPCLLTDRDKMSNHYRGPSIDAYYQVSIHWTKRFQKRYFLEIDQSETRIDSGGHVCYRIGTKWAIFIDDLPKVLPTKYWFICESGFRGEDYQEIDQWETRIACEAMFLNGSRRNEQSS